LVILVVSTLQLVALWFVNEWMMAGSPEDIKLVELGPGRGTMADDMLRVWNC
jgi:NADH dehydrogenase [ubiquinone] 1 alpha subcomplex assembly factor 7